MDRADRLGNVQTLGPDPYFDEQFARAAKRCYVSCEELVERIDQAHSADARLNLVERSYISGVVAARFGAHPTSNPPAYGWDLEHLKAYCALATESGGWERYFSEFVAVARERVSGKRGRRHAPDFAAGAGVLNSMPAHATTLWPSC